MIELGEQWHRQDKLKKSKIAAILGFHRNSFYTLRVLEKKDKDLEKRINDLYEIDDTLGHKKLAVLLKTSRKRVLRVMRKYGVVARKKKSKYRYGGKSNVVYPNLLPDINFEKDEVIFSDILEFRLADRTKVYCCFVIRCYTRQIVSFCYSYQMKAELVLETLNYLEIMKLPKEVEVIFHSDQGSQYGAKMTTEKLAEFGFRQSMSRAGTPTDNAIAERFVGIFKLAVVERYRYETIGEFAGSAEKWLNFYNRKRPHESLGMKSPDRFALKNRSENVSFLVVNCAQ